MRKITKRTQLKKQESSSKDEERWKRLGIQDVTTNVPNEPIASRGSKFQVQSSKLRKPSPLALSRPTGEGAAQKAMENYETNPPSLNRRFQDLRSEIVPEDVVFEIHLRNPRYPRSNENAKRSHAVGTGKRKGEREQDFPATSNFTKRTHFRDSCSLVCIRGSPKKLRNEPIPTFATFAPSRETGPNPGDANLLTAHGFLASPNATH
jgi:hypothetical protein